ncbi:MAG: polyprenyl synthetase family protein [Flavobacteriales bacterium]|nr:polyprenyl synthetase family protein [Flavobacteriales bacterium]
MSILSDIQSPIKEEMKGFEEKFRSSMTSRVPLLNKITHYIVKRKGKQMRPMFVFLSARMFGKPSESTFTAANLIELLHTATLVHDDVVDDAYERRGFFSLNALWKNKIAVLVGDYLLSKGLMLSIDSGEFKLLQIVSNAVKEMSEGELLQIEKARKLDITEEVYFDIIRQKTAVLIASCCASGASSMKQSDDTIEKMRLFGEKVGIAFQIKDDLFDYGLGGKIGKPTGIDIKEKKLTLPLIYTLNNCKKNIKKSIINTVKNHNEDKEKVNEVIDHVFEHGGIDYASQIMKNYADEALQLLQEFPDSEAKNKLHKLVTYTIEREK